MSAYGAITSSKGYPDITSLFPITAQIKGNQTVRLALIHNSDQPELVTFSRASPIYKTTFSVLHEILNDEVLNSSTYPQEEPFTAESFAAYYYSHHVFLLYVPLSEDGSLDSSLADSQKIIGAFYVKPNFPGRSSHICNAGFLVSKSWRGSGAGKYLGSVMPRFAKALGYRASMFNLVYANNPASIAIWRKTPGYIQTGQIPNALCDKDGKYYDALQFYNDFYQTQAQPEE